MRRGAVLNMGNIFSNSLISMNREESHLLSSVRGHVLIPAMHMEDWIPSPVVIHSMHAVSWDPSPKHAPKCAEWGQEARSGPILVLVLSGNETEETSEISLWASPSGKCENDLWPSLLQGKGTRIWIRKEPRVEVQQQMIINLVLF